MTIVDRLTTALESRYRVDCETGVGGMATVYLAHDLKHERDVAIKVLHPDLGAPLGRPKGHAYPRSGAWRRRMACVLCGAAE